MASNLSISSAAAAAAVAAAGDDDDDDDGDGGGDDDDDDGDGDDVDVIMQYITEKDGVVVDRRIEKRTTKVTTLDDNEEDIDYDQV